MFGFLGEKASFGKEIFPIYRNLFLIIGLVLILSSSLVLYRSQVPARVGKIVLRREIFAIDMDDVAAESFGLKDKDLEGDIEERNFDSYRGIEYINRIFFQRFKKKFYKTVKIKSAIVLVLALVANLLISRLSLNDADAMDYFTYGFCLIGFLAGFLIYIGDRFTRLYFYNMDRFLMKNKFYRTPGLLKDAIKIRFKKMVTYNIPMLIILNLGLMGILYQVKTPWFSYILTLAFSLLGMVFFNFHYLYTYCLIQPFTENMEVKNPLYSILNIFAYYIAISLMLVVEKYRWVAIWSILAFVILYIGLGFVLVTKLAYKRFKLR